MITSRHCVSIAGHFPVTFGCQNFLCHFQHFLVISFWSLSVIPMLSVTGHFQKYHLPKWITLSAKDGYIFFKKSKLVFWSLLATFGYKVTIPSSEKNEWRHFAGHFFKNQQFKNVFVPIPQTFIVEDSQNVSLLYKENLAIFVFKNTSYLFRIF